MAGFLERAKKAYSILANVDEPSNDERLDEDQTRPSTISSALYSRVWRDTSSKVLAPITTRFSVDASLVPIRHVVVDDDESFLDYKFGSVDDRLVRKANIDQTGVALVQDAITTMLEEGVCVIVPIQTSKSPIDTTGYDIWSMRIGTVTQWYNKAVQVSIYNEITGQRVEKVLPKSYVGVVYNPFYNVMNQPNSTLKRLIDKQALLDLSDGRVGSPGLDLILQLPYSTKAATRQEEAEKRRSAIEKQLYDSAYGIAYIGSTEKVTQLNRPVNNTLLDGVKILKEELYNQIGLTPSILNGTASEEELNLYYNRTLEPLLKALTDGLMSACLTDTAIAQGQRIMAMPNNFRMASISSLAEAADKLLRNEVLSGNEARTKMFRIRPSDDPDANELRNKNLNKADNEKSPIAQPKSADTKEQ